jgi:hypothetical protein
METPKSNYEIYRERVEENAKSYPPPPTDVDQVIVWIKASASHKIENSELYGNENGVFTFKSGEKFGFSEKYVNLLMHYAYIRGKAVRDEDYKRATKDMAAALDKIKDSLDDIGWIDYPESY